MPAAIVLITGDVVVPAPTFRLLGDALTHASTELSLAGCNYDAIALIEQARKLLGLPQAIGDSLAQS